MRQVTSAINEAKAAAAVLALLLLAPPAAARPKEPVMGGFVETFDEGLDKRRWFVADGWANGKIYDAGWRRDAATVEDGRLVLTLDDRPASGKPHSAAEVQMRGMVGHGSYEVRMRPPKGVGVVSAFFLYTGPSLGSPWQEIDIEFLGRDTGLVQFNTYVDGKKNGEHLHELGFDAAEGFHTYRIDWTPEAIVWSVDGREAHRLEARRHRLPPAPQKLFLHLWPGKGVDGWLGRFRYPGTPIRVAYDCVSYVPLGETGPSCSEPGL